MNNETIELFEQMEDEYLAHYGTKRHSGRYPWGSGEVPYQHEPGFPDTPPYSSAKDWLNDYDKLKKEGIDEKEIAKMFDFGSTTNLRAAHRAAIVYARNDERNLALKYRNEGKSLRDIAKLMGYNNDSSIRALLNEATNQNKNRIFEIAKQIKDGVDKYKRVDVGEGVEQYFKVSQETLEQALYILKAEYGYQIQKRRIPQQTNPGQYTVIRAAVPPDSPNNFLYQPGMENRVIRLKDYGSDTDDTEPPALKPAFNKPESLARNRLMIRYKEDGGVEKDGLIEIRPGCKDLSLGDASYSQVRIAVSDEKGEPKYYLKGMAVYNKNLPKGIDVLVNSNKSRYVEDKYTHAQLKDKNGKPIPNPDSEVLKELKTIKKGENKGQIDWENPFGSVIKEDGGQYFYTDEKTGEEKLGLINKRADEGDWLNWSKSLPAQFLAKQDPKFIRRQLELTVANKLDEFDEIKQINNPVVKQKLLSDFAGALDSQAVHLKAASLPRQKYQVILPVNSLKDNEVYAPNFNPGERIALVRFPHAGPFEIPILTVNNNNKEGKEMIGPLVEDAIGINHYNAEKLSGADFDGDTVIAIPLSDRVNIVSKPFLPGLRGFDPKEQYPPQYKLDEQGNKVYDENGKPIITSKTATKKTHQIMMGEATNLITDMTLMNADDEEIARAVRHSMVVVDSLKHKLDYSKSAIDNGIKELKMKYQAHDSVKWDGKITKNSTAAATIISAAKSQKVVPVHEGRQIIDPETGKLVWTREGYKTRPKLNKKTGEWEEVIKTTKSNWMSDTDDAFSLVRDKNNPIEVAYAEYANALKALANEVRKEKVNTPNLKYNPEMAIKYKEEVENLNKNLRKAQMNRPREREAQMMADIMFEEYQAMLNEVGEDMDDEEKKKYRDRFLKKARIICGAQREEIPISDREWEAIQNGALTHTKVSKIFERTDPDVIKQRATPRKEFQWTSVRQRLAYTMANSGYTINEIAERLGTSTTTVSRFLKERK